MGAKTLFLITVTTARMFFPGMQDMPKIPGVKMPNLNAPTRTLRMDLTSPKKATVHSTAQVAIPEGLKLGPKVDLIIDLPVQTPDSSGKPDNEKPGKTQEFTMKIYWSCAQTVPDGQPKVVKTSEMMKSFSPQQMKQVQKQMDKAIKEAEDNSHAYWPGPKAPEIASDAATPGDWALTTNYVGGTSVAFAKGQDFLAPIELSSPKGEVDLAKAVKLEWKAVPNATAYLLTAFAGNDKEMVMWSSSSSSDSLVTADIYNGAISSADMQNYISKGILLPPTTTSCSIPAGIFKEVGNPILMVTAYGADKIQTKDNIETQIVVRSTATMTMGAGMGPRGSDDQNGDVQGDNNGDNAEVTGDQTTEQPTDQADKSSDDSGSLKDKLKKTLGKFGRKK